MFFYKTAVCAQAQYRPEILLFAANVITFDGLNYCGVYVQIFTFYDYFFCAGAHHREIAATHVRIQDV